MTWKPWLFLVFALPVIAFVFWIYGSSVFPETGTSSTAAIASSEQVPITEPLVSFVDPWRGAESPTVTIVEYGNYACPYCREAHTDIGSLLVEHDDVRFVWKDLPSDLYTGTDIAAEAAHCAKDQGMFWEYQDKLFAQNDLFNQTSLTLTANELGLDLDRFGVCLSGGEKRYLVERSVSEAEALGVDGTPYFFIDGKPYSGQLDYADIIDAARS